MMLVGSLLERGARTKTVERLTGAGELIIRDIYREMHGVSPARGPSNYSFGHYLATPLVQFDASVAVGTLERHLQMYADNEGRRPGPGVWLGQLYCDAFDTYKDFIGRIRIIDEPMSFERFAYLGLLVPKRSVLQLRECCRCGGQYLAGIGPQFAQNSKCPLCMINSKRSCVRCGGYVPLDDGDIPPRRQPMCIECAMTKGRVSTQKAYEKMVGRQRFG